LEEALQLSSDANKNTVREAIKNSFCQRKLVTLPRPSTNTDVAQRMEDKLSCLSKSFVKSVDALRTTIFDEITPLTAQETTLSGKMYSTLCRHYTDIIQTNSVPVIKDSWTLLAAVKARDLKDALVSECSQLISKMIPKPKEKLESEMSQLKKYLMEQFVKKSMKPIDQEVKDVLEKQITTMFEASKQKLMIDISSKVEKSLQSLENEISTSPERLSIILNTELSRFSEEHDNDSDFVKTWMMLASERALCRWIPRSLQALSSQRDDIQGQLEQLKNTHELRLNECKEKNDELLRDERIRHSELEQTIDANNRKIKVEIDDNLRLQKEIIVLSMEIRALEQIKESAETVTVMHSSDNDSLDEIFEKYQEELATCKIENAELKSKLSAEMHNSEKHKRLYKDADEKLEKASTMHAKLQENWKHGIEKLRHEQQTQYERQKADYETRLSTCASDISSLNATLATEKEKVADVLLEKKRLEDRIQQEAENNERNIANLRENAQRYREQSELAQSRVLEIHKSMLDDLRVRDERSREQQSKIIKETSEYQQRISDINRENELHKTDILNGKRRIAQLETIESECKRFRISDREKDIMISQLKAENTELRNTNNDMLNEREKLRKENMSMEGELSLLRAEKQLFDARRDMTGDFS
jgi:hypothetical protein